jgi:glycosyltransferase involved in cell wall biosynthesis
MKTAAIIPAYNESASIRDIIKRTHPFVDETVVIDDGSTDQTASEARQAGATLILHPKRAGKGAALLTGFSYAIRQGFEAVVTLDADGQHAPEEIPKLVECACRSQADMVVGIRSKDLRKMPLTRFLSNAFSSLFISLLTRRYLSDVHSGFRWIRLDPLSRIQINSPGFEIETELILRFVQNRFKIAQIEIDTIYNANHSKIDPLMDTLRYFGMIGEYVLSGGTLCMRNRGVRNWWRS